MKSFSGFSLAGKDWKISFLSFYIHGDIPFSLFLVIETHSLHSSTSLFYFYAAARKAFYEKVMDYTILHSSASFSFQKMIL